MLTVGGIIGGGLRLVRERPISVLVWGLIYIGITAAGTVTLFVPLFQMVALNAAQHVPPDPAAMLGLMAKLYLFYFGLMIVLIMLMAAGTRAALQPEQGAFAYMRIGMDELRLLGLGFLLFIVTFVVMILLFILFAIVLAASGALNGGNPGQMNGLSIVLMLLIYALPIFFYVRLSPALALTMIREKIVIGEAWRLSSGHFWKMFAGYLVLGLLVMVAYMAILFAVFLPFTAGIGAGTAPRAMAELMQGHLPSGMIYLLIGGGAVLAILSGIGIALYCGGIAAATNQLLGVTDVDYAATFE